jgi:hypothetical protein
MIGPVKVLWVEIQMAMIQPLQSIMIMVCKKKCVLILPMDFYIIYIYLSCTRSKWPVKLHCLDIFCYIRSLNHFWHLIHVDEHKNPRISVEDHRWRIWKRWDRRFSYFRTIWQLFLILQDKHNIGTLSINIKLICTRCETE